LARDGNPDAPGAAVAAPDEKEEDVKPEEKE